MQGLHDLRVLFRVVPGEVCSHSGLPGSDLNQVPSSITKISSDLQVIQLFINYAAAAVTSYWLILFCFRPGK